MARSKNIWGPFEGYEHNPVLTNANTSEYRECFLQLKVCPHIQIHRLYSADCRACRCFPRHGWELVGSGARYEERNRKLVSALNSRTYSICNTS